MGEVMVLVVPIVAGLIIASIPVLKLVEWVLDGTLDAPPAIVGIFLYVALTASMMGAPGYFKAVILVILVASAVMTPMLGAAKDKKQLKRMDDDKLHAYASALERNPMDAPARLALAEALEKRGELEPAIAHLEWTLSQYPALSPRIKPQLDSWKRALDRQGVAQPIICHRCHTENIAGAIRCSNCEAQFGVKAGIAQEVERQGGPQRVLRGWIVVSTYTLIVGFLLIQAVLYLPSIVIGPIILATTIVAGVIFLRWVGGDLGAPA